MTYPEDAAPSGQPLRILVVDDTDAVREMTVRELQEGGYDAIGAIDGVHARGGHRHGEIGEVGLLRLC
jgi:hypothetical protein